MIYKVEFTVDTDHLCAKDDETEVREPTEEEVEEYLKGKLVGDFRTINSNNYIFRNDGLPFLDIDIYKL